MKRLANLLLIFLCGMTTAHTQSLDELGQLYMEYYQKGDYLKAIEYTKMALRQAENELGRQHEICNIIASNLGHLYNKTGDYDKALLLQTGVMNYCKDNLGTDHPDYATALNNLATTYDDMGNFSKAEELTIEALNIRGRVLGKDHPDYVTSLNNLAYLYDEMGNYAEAEPLYIEALNITGTLFGKEYPGYASILNNLASLYMNAGNYSKAEPLLIEAMNILEKVSGKDHPDYAGSLNNLASFYFFMGNYSKAEPLFIESLSIQKNLFGEFHPSYISTLFNLAELYQNMANPECLRIYEKVASISREMYGPHHLEYAKYIKDYAMLLTYIGEYSKAEALQKKSMHILKKQLGPDHPEYASSLQSLAMLKNKLGKHSRALNLQLKAMNILRINLGPDHPRYANSLNNLGAMYEEHGKYDQADAMYIQANQILNKQLDNTHYYLSENEKERFLQNNLNFHFEIYNSYFLRRKATNPAVAGISYNNELAHKGILLQSNTSLRNLIMSSGNDELITIYNTYIKTQKQLSVLYSTPLAERKTNVDSLENSTGIMEKELIRKAEGLPGVKNILGLTQTNWQDVQQVLEPDEAAIEFIHFNYEHENWTDSILYCAMILCRDYEYPEMIFLFEEKQLQELLSTPKATSSPYYIGQLYSCHSELPGPNEATPCTNELYNLIWQPIDSLLQDIKTVYIAPGGLLNKVSFYAIPVNDSTFLSDKYSINLVTSTRILSQVKQGIIPEWSSYRAVLYGGIDYDFDSTMAAEQAIRYVDTGLSIPARNRSFTWTDLSGTLTETSEIKDLLQQNDVAATLYTGRTATEESFKHMVVSRGSPEIIHLATHGFYFPELDSVESLRRNAFTGSSLSEEPVYIHSENPLIRSGILLAGANRAWSNPSGMQGAEDGILTAYDVSLMNLHNTQLVVLSACETGLGDVKGSEGVFGLQRALKMAGVRYMVMSLWQVPDYQTSLLMTLFYENWLSGMSIRDAFAAAQKTMREKYSPFSWAAFILTE